MHEELLELERRFWEASSARDGDFHRTRVTDDALYVFPGTAGPWSREECATAVEENDAPWAWFEIQQPRFVDLADGAVLLTYISRSQHEGAEPFSMLVSTVYRATDEGWKLAFHQQTMALSEYQEAEAEYKAGGAAAFETTPLLTVEETLAALERASSINYRPPGEG